MAYIRLLQTVKLQLYTRIKQDAITLQFSTVAADNWFIASEDRLEHG